MSIDRAVEIARDRDVDERMAAAEMPDLYDRFQTVPVSWFVEAPWDYLIPDAEADKLTLMTYIAAAALNYGHDRELFKLSAADALDFMFRKVLDPKTAEIWSRNNG